MAKELIKEALSEKVYTSIEELKVKFNTPQAVFVGTAASHGWMAGKQLTEEEYKRAVSCFEKAPAGRR